MAVPEKSSDEILKELFGMCQRKMGRKFSDCSRKSGSEDEDSDSSIQKHHKKKKKKKKKHKKSKKRKRSSSIDSQTLENESYKRKKKKSCKRYDDLISNNLPGKRIELKIKKEKNYEVPRLLTVNETINSEENSQNQNYLDKRTGKSLTLDDVFSTLGIVTEGPELPIKIKKEKEDSDSKSLNAVEGKLESHETVVTISIKTESNTLKINENEETLDKEKNRVTDIFDGCGNNFVNDAEKQKMKSKKISIKNLKNSTVYEATIKEIEEQERLRAEKYEEGELMSSSVSDLSSADEELIEKGYHSEAGKDHYHKHKKRPKSCDKSRSTYRSHSYKRKHRHRKESYHEDKSSEKYRNRRSLSSHSHHHHHHHHNHLSSGIRNSSLSPRFQGSRRKKPGRSKESRSRSRERKSNSTEKIDKQKLLEIARKNAITLLQQGALPASVIASKDKFTSIKAGGKTVDELTDFCKQLSRKDAEGHDSISSNSEADSGDDKGKPFHHPFQLKERPACIVMNIRNSVPLPTKTAQKKTMELSKQLSLQYPVSSGQQHRTTENVWVPVEKSQENTVVFQPSKVFQAQKSDTHVNVAYPIKPATSCPVLPAYPSTLENSVLPKIDSGIDISTIVAQRLEAIRRLSENPQDPIGTNIIQSIDSKMTLWAESKVQPGLFTGSTGVKPLSVAELSSGCQAWPKKNQFSTAKPVYSDKGEALMKKMGWQPGEGLGKYKQGPSIPCEISMKTDRKGLAEQPMPKNFKQKNILQKAFEITQSKHPVSLLNEFCSRKKIGVPQYDCEEKEGAGRRKLFIFTVTVQGMKYTPKMPSTNKKQSKVEAATVCLQSLGLLPVVHSSA